MTSPTKDHVDRVKRFDLDVPAKWRVHGEQRWHSAIAKNASTSGVLVCGAERAEIGTELEVWILTHTDKRNVADIVCDSIVVRCQEEHTRDLPFSIGMKLQHYKLRPAQA